MPWNFWSGSTLVFPQFSFSVTYRAVQVKNLRKKVCTSNVECVTGGVGSRALEARVSPNAACAARHVIERLMCCLFFANIFVFLDFPWFQEEAELAPVAKHSCLPTQVGHRL